MQHFGYRLNFASWLISVAAVGVFLGQARLVEAAGTIVLENAQLKVEFSTVDGSIARLRNKTKGLELISADRAASRPWAMLLDRAQLVSDFEQFQVVSDQKTPHQKLSFQWKTKYQIAVTAEAELLPHSDALRLTSAATNSGDHTIVALRYPDIQGIGMLSAGGKSDRLLHSTMMGAVFDNPFQLFQHDSPIAQGRGMVVSRYPNGFYGSALQLMAYYAEGSGGFYVAAEDGNSTDKDLNFFKANSDSLSCEVAHFNWDARPGTSLQIDYPVVIAAMTSGSWYEAAKRYRDWGLEQSWCSRGTLQERVAKNDASRWLLEDIGAVGMWWPFRNDIRPQIERTRELLGAPLLHLELWWQHQESVAAAHSHGDRFGPFYFPHLALKGRSSFQLHSADAISPPSFSISPDWVAMCASQNRWRQTFLETAEDMVGSGNARHHQIWMEDNPTGCDADCLYYDIGPCAGIPTHCYAGNHDHAPGAGRQITDGHVSLLRESQQRASKAKGTYVPIGTECISEPFVGCLDLYYPRNAGFGLDMELFPYVRQLTWLPDGRMEVVPLFAFVYHEHGPLAVQGVYSADPWVTSKADDINTWAEARSYLWGGVVTMFPLHEAMEVTPERRRVLQSFTAARTDFAKEFLAYGRMQQPPPLHCATIELNHGLAAGGWLRKLRFEDESTAAEAVGIEASDEATKTEAASSTAQSKSDLTVEQWVTDILAVGAAPATDKTVTVPSVACNAYTLGNDRLGILLINLQHQRITKLAVWVDPVSYGLDAGEYQLQRRTHGSAIALESFRDRQQIQVDLPSREVVLLEAVHTSTASE